MNPSHTPNTPNTPNMQPDAKREPVDISQQSVAGEEDPGASLDMTGSSSRSPIPATSAINPGDEAAPGTPGTGEDICRKCGGSGQCSNGSECPACGGTGKVTVGVGGG